ncbi:MAG: hypothetical protein ACRD1G_02500 [Acidimicrobiales bacterium]
MRGARGDCGRQGSARLEETVGGTGALHLASAWATEAGLVLAQRIDGKTDEIPAIPELLDVIAPKARSIGARNSDLVNTF